MGNVMQHCKLQTPLGSIYASLYILSTGKPGHIPFYRWKHWGWEGPMTCSRVQLTQETAGPTYSARTEAGPLSSWWSSWWRHPRPTLNTIHLAGAGHRRDKPHKEPIIKQDNRLPSTRWKHSWPASQEDITSTSLHPWSWASPMSTPSSPGGSLPCNSLAPICPRTLCLQGSHPCTSRVPCATRVFWQGFAGSFLWNLRGHHAHGGHFNWCRLLSLDRMPAVPDELVPSPHLASPPPSPSAMLPWTTSSRQHHDCFLECSSLAQGVSPPHLGEILIPTLLSPPLFKWPNNNIHVMVSTAEWQRRHRAPHPGGLLPDCMEPRL